MALHRIGLVRLPGLTTPFSNTLINSLTRQIYRSRHLQSQRAHLTLRPTRILNNSPIQSNTAPFPTYFQPPPEPPPPRPRRSLLRRAMTTIAIIIASSIVGLYTSIQLADEVAEESVTSSLTPEETLALYNPPPGSSAYIVDTYMRMHPLAVQLRADRKYVESRPQLRLSSSVRAQNMSAGTLMGPHMFEVPPLVFADTESPLPSSVSFHHIGPKLIVAPGIVHSGILATILDEGLARACFPALPSHIGVTAYLNIDYKRPEFGAGEYFLVLRAETTKVEGRKAWVKGRLEMPADETRDKPIVIAEAEALFVEPKYLNVAPKFVTSRTPRV